MTLPNLSRCPWAESAPDYQKYHDEEWGVPLRGDDALFERVALESFQSGLSWITILRKRPAFRRGFADFVISGVAAFSEDDVTRLLNDASIVRNERKIRAVIKNAQLAEQLPNGLDQLLWSFAPATGQTRPEVIDDVPAITPESTAMAAALKKRGFTFVGPTTCYALMQATGMVDDHLSTCFRANASSH